MLKKKYDRYLLNIKTYLIPRTYYYIYLIYLFYYNKTHFFIKLIVLFFIELRVQRLRPLDWILLFVMIYDWFRTRTYAEK